jgi:hypothetical protein
LIDKRTYDSPAGNDKSIFIGDIQIPISGGYYIRAIVDATDCSLCNVGSGCNPINDYQLMVQKNNAKPYWFGQKFFDNSSLSKYELQPLGRPRSLTSSPDCNCKVKLP